MHKCFNLKKNIINKSICYLCAILFLIILFVSLHVHIIYNREKQEKEDISIIVNNLNNDDNEIINNKINNMIDNNNVIHDNIIPNNIVNNDLNDNNVIANNSLNDDDFDCIIEIPDIDLSKIVYTGKHREQHLNKYELVTAVYDMKYSQGGNYIICGHASRLYGHSLNRLKEIKKGAVINIWFNDNKDEYIVNNVYYVNMFDTDKYCKQNNQNEITILSCAKYISYNSYIVIKAIPK